MSLEIGLWSSETAKKELESYLALQLPAPDCTITSAQKLPGGAIQQNWVLAIKCTSGEFAPASKILLRTDASSSVSDSHDRGAEFELLSVAQNHNVLVPKPLCNGQESILGKPWFVTAFVPGIAAGHLLTKDSGLPGGTHKELLAALGHQLAHIHSIRQGNNLLPFLKTPALHPALAFVQEFRTFLDTLSWGYPALEWGLRYVEQNLPDTEVDSQRLRLCHRDFRTGNYLVNESGLQAILDWEFAGWSYPEEDIGWFCARCWRFAQPDLEAGGIGPRSWLYEAYNSAAQALGNPEIHQEDVAMWELVATLRWAMIAIKQTMRHLSGQERNLELALTGHILPELELQVLQKTGINYA